jgi:hypothetical protein
MGLEASHFIGEFSTGIYIYIHIHKIFGHFDGEKRGNMTINHG